MNTLQVENLLRSDCKLATIFDGVFASDRLPSLCDSKTAMVVNIDPYNSPGSHWVCMYIENGKGEFFDSYGEYPYVHSFINFLNRNCKSWTFNRVDLQAIDSDVCGHYCIHFLSERARGKSMEEIVAQFSVNNKNKNDAGVKEMVETRFGRIADSFLNDGSQCQCCIKRRR